MYASLHSLCDQSARTFYNSFVRYCPLFLPTFRPQTIVLNEFKPTKFTSPVAAPLNTEEGLPSQHRPLGMNRNECNILNIAHKTLKKNRKKNKKEENRQTGRPLKR